MRLKKIFAAAMLATLAFAMTPSHAATTSLKLTGHVKHSNTVGAQVADPAVAQYVTEFSDACKPGGAHAGEDGMWFALPTGADAIPKNTPATLSFTDKLGVYPGGKGTDAGRVVPGLGRYPMLGTDMDVAWYQATYKADGSLDKCASLGSSGLGQSSNPEVGTVPDKANFVIVNYFLGLDNVDFTLQIGTAAA